MPSDRQKLRGLLLAEDKRTERFFRELLAVLGFKTRSFRFETAPAGEGAADAWVLQRYPAEVKVLRSKNYQQGLRLIAVRDGNSAGLASRKHQNDQALQDAGLAERHAAEGIASPVPARNIETWLLALLGADDLDESTDFKRRFENEHNANETSALRDGASAWKDIDQTWLPSLRDGKTEMERLDP